MIRQTLNRKMNHARTMLALIIVAVVSLAVVGVASASAIPTAGGGILNGGNLSVEVNGAAAGAGGPCINFFNGNTPDACPPSSTDTFTLDGPSDPIFGTPGTTTGTTHDFVLANQVGSAYTGGTGFLAINGFSFDITSIVVPNASPCPPVGTPGVCSVSDFTLTQTDPSHVLIGFSANGIGYSGTSASGSTPYTFSWTSQFPNETVADILAKANATPLGITDSVSFTGTPLPGVPEPAAFVLAGIGLLGIGAFGRRRRRGSSKKV